MPPQNVDAMATVTRAVKQPVCTSEELVGRHGFVTVSDAPGLGVGVDEAVVREHTAGQPVAA